VISRPIRAKPEGITSARARMPRTSVRVQAAAVLGASTLHNAKRTANLAKTADIPAMRRGYFRSPRAPNFWLGRDRAQPVSG
jgi:hypothetical protein